jgi:hypothetical protein
MSRHNNAKVEVRDANGNTPAVHLADAASAGNDAELETARLAYSYWESRGGSNGSPEQDWARAEQELRERQR